jgi:hypothetical protein
MFYQDGDYAPLPTDLVLQALGPYVKPLDEETWELSFPDGGGGEMNAIEPGSQAFDLCISDPSGDDLYAALFEIMRQTHTVLWWSGGLVPVTADPSIAQHLPDDFEEEDGPPILVGSVEDILAEIAKT